MSGRHCLNCDSALSAAARFCPHCGQRSDTARLSLADMVRELMHSFVDVERRPLAFARALLLRPGVVAREYVDGRRRRHYGPFATLAVLVGLAALAFQLSGFQVLTQEGVAPVPATLLHRHFNLVLLAQLPLLGGLCALLFRRDGLALPEHMVLVAYTLGVRSLVLTIMVLIALLNATPVSTPLQNFAFWAAWYVYFGWAASQFYRGRRWATALRGALTAALGHASIIGLLVAGSAVYETVRILR